MYPENEAKHFLRTIKEEHIETAALTTNSLHSAKNQHVLICCGVRKTCFIDGARSVFFFLSRPTSAAFFSAAGTAAQRCMTFSKLAASACRARRRVR